MDTCDGKWFICISQIHDIEIMLTKLLCVEKPQKDHYGENELFIKMQFW